MNMEPSIIVSQIPSKEAEPWILVRHYAKRKCPISYAFGAFRNNELIGIVTFGTPASSTLRKGIAGNEWMESVLELNRLCCLSGKNTASILVGRALRLLPKPSIIVSYADTAQGHIGYVYQATNFIYTGLSAKRTDWKIKGKEHLHGATIADESRGQIDRAKWMREKYGDDFYLEQRSRKHRYIYLCGNLRERLKMRSSLMYCEQPYPKGETRRYDASGEIQTQSTLF
jgi:hypothetical protein